MADLNKESRGEGAIIKSVEFHKKENVALVAGQAGVITLFQVISTVQFSGKMFGIGLTWMIG